MRLGLRRDGFGLELQCAVALLGNTAPGVLHGGVRRKRYSLDCSYFVQISIISFIKEFVEACLVSIWKLYNTNSNPPARDTVWLDVPLCPVYIYTLAHI